MHANPWESSGQVTRPETTTATTVGTFWASSSPRIFPQGGASYGKSAKSRELYSFQAPFVAASRGVEKVTLLLNSFPVKASVTTYFLMHDNSFPVKVGASPLSEFEDLGLGLDTPVAGREISLGLHRSKDRTLTAEEGLNPVAPPTPMSLEEQITELTRQLRDLQAQLTAQGQPAATAAPPPTPCPSPETA